jgi:hypothetical protein
MVYKSQDYWVFLTLSIIWYSKKHKRPQSFGNWMFPSLGEGWETPTLLGLLESPTPHPRMEISSFQNVLFCFLEYQMMDKVQKTQ